MGELLLDIKDLSIQYVIDGTVTNAVNGISMQIHKGECMGLVGETGAGKTTTALSILRLLPKYITKIQGDIEFDGESIMNASEKRMRELRGRHISMIFQDPMTSLNPVFTVGSQIADVIHWHDMSLSKEQVEEQVDAILETVGIPKSRKEEYPHQFSGGMKQRVVIAMALSCDPDLLIADEPTSALDVTIQAQVLETIAALQKQKRTAMILITHDLAVVAENCQNVAIVYAGEIVEYGSIAQVYSRPMHPYTLGLFGSLPHMAKGEKRLPPIAGMMPNPAHLPEGCKFNPRCPHCTDKCRDGEFPVPIYRNGTHEVQCHKVFEEGGAK
mgnify:CR=1 FL=1